MAKQDRRVTHAQFFQVCEWLRNKQEMLTTERPSMAKLVVIAKEQLGFNISDATLAEAKTSVGITWDAKYERGVGGGGGARMRLRELAKIVRDLHVKLGEKVPANLAALCGHAEIEPEPEPAKPEPVVLGIPIKTVPKPQTIPVVNGRR